MILLICCFLLLFCLASVWMGDVVHREQSHWNKSFVFFKGGLDGVNLRTFFWWQRYPWNLRTPLRGREGSALTFSGSSVWSTLQSIKSSSKQSYIGADRKQIIKGNVRDMASSIRVTLAKWAVLGMPKQRMPWAWRHSAKCRWKALGPL